LVHDFARECEQLETRSRGRLPVSAINILIPMGVALFAASPDQPAEIPELAIPFGCGRGFTVSQAHQTGSHLHNDSFAWDIRMPEGEPIVAAMDGVVRLARGDSTSGGCDISYAKDSNYVVLAHANGLETQYLHFSKVTVKPGDAVKAGDLIGYSGKTGWACGAHLHFKLARTMGEGWNNPSIPARLAGYGDPQTGDWVQSPTCSDERPYIASLNEPSVPSDRTSGAQALVERVESASRRESVPAAVVREATLRGSSSSMEQVRPASGTDGVLSNK
jgi:murein DD-endopeptidase MepM/ murein hydrolase activator NlpD